MLLRPIRDIFRSYAVFDAEGRHVNGSDKQSNHSYGDAYEKIIRDVFGNFGVGRESVKLMMEVGVADGSSLLAWREVFPNALCVGMDIHIASRLGGLLVCDDRIEFYLGDQRSMEDCCCAAGGRQFDLIVEDATHQLDDTLRTLLYLWPYVKPGGLYVVEEFANIGALVANVVMLWPNADVVGTCGPNMRDEPLIVFRKPTGVSWKPTGVSWK